MGIKPGQNLLTFGMSDMRGSCNVTYEVTGIGNGEPFKIKGPCVVPADQEVIFRLILDGDDVSFPPITNLGPSVLNVTKDGNLHKFKFQGEEISSGTTNQTANGGDLAITFIDAGEYEVEFVWMMPSAPPDGHQSPVEVSRATFNITVEPAGTVIPPDPPLPPGEKQRCHGNTINDAWQAGLLGTVRCIGGEPVAVTNDKNIKNQIEDFEKKIKAQIGISLTPKEKDDLIDIVRDCTEEHEQDHVGFFADPIVTPFDVCAGCGNCGATAFDDADPEECRVLQASEADGHQVSADCFYDAAASFTKGSIKERILTALADANQNEADERTRKFSQCP